MTSPGTTRISPLALAAAFAAIYLGWGSTYVAIKIGIETIPPFLMAGFRFLAAGAPLYLFLRLRGTVRPSRAHWIGALLIGTLMLACGNGMVTRAEKIVPSGIAAVTWRAASITSSWRPQMISVGAVIFVRSLDRSGRRGFDCNRASLCSG